MNIQEDQLREPANPILKFPEQINRSQQQTRFFRCENLRYVKPCAMRPRTRERYSGRALTRISMNEV